MGVADALVEPLFHLCWVHRSLKEAARLRAPELGQGLYINLVTLCAREPARRALVHLSAR